VWGWFGEKKVGKSDSQPRKTYLLREELEKNPLGGTRVGNVLDIPPVKKKQTGKFMKVNIGLAKRNQKTARKVTGYCLGSKRKGTLVAWIISGGSHRKFEGLAGSAVQR